MRTGTYSVGDLLTDRAASSTNVLAFGVDNLIQPLQAELDAHNEQVRDGMLNDLSEPTTERVSTYGVAQDQQMQDADEYTAGPTQKAQAMGEVAYPLKKKQFPLGWTHDYFIRTTVADMVQHQINAQIAHVNAIRAEIMRAVFVPTNYTTRDKFVADKLSLTVRRLVNGDGQPIPARPTGDGFDSSTHTHYRATASTSGAGLKTALTALIDTVVEHGHGSAVRLYINLGSESAVRELDGFYEYFERAVDPGANAARARGELDTSAIDDRAIGVFHGAQVWVKPWVPVDYYFTFDAGAAGKTLRMREPIQAALQGLRIAANLHTHPLHSEFMEAYFGFGVHTRTNGAVLYANAGNGGIYAAPSL